MLKSPDPTQFYWQGPGAFDSLKRKEENPNFNWIIENLESRKVSIYMDFKNFLITVLPGIAGTIGMTAVMYLYAAITNQFTKVIHLLGSMISIDPNHQFSGKNGLILSDLGHFGVG